MQEETEKCEGCGEAYGKTHELRNALKAIHCIALVRRMRGAKWRLRHYAGIPFVHISGREDAIQYETALDDCEALADAIEAAGGARPQVTDIRKEFQARASLTLSQLRKAAFAERPC